MATDIEIQARVLRQLVVRLQRARDAFDPASDDYISLQTGVDQAITRTNELRAELGKEPLRPETQENPFLNIPNQNPNP